MRVVFTAWLLACGSVCVSAAVRKEGPRPAASRHAAGSSSAISSFAGQTAPVALYRDPIHDGAADPVVVWNRARKAWWMLYTSRRADETKLSGVSWEYGTKIGIAESKDGGAHWRYVGTADIPFGKPDYTFWAPDVIRFQGTYHMFLTVVPGTYTDWRGTRRILHLTSSDLMHWKPQGYANLVGDKVIDPCLFQLPNGNWRMWYKNAADNGKIYFSDSNDLVHWTPRGIAITSPGEGPVVFQWRGSYWMIEDAWNGLAVFRSTNLTTWKRQPHNLLRKPGLRPTDRAQGAHPDVVVDAADHAWLFYFTPQSGADAKPGDPLWRRRTVIHVTELHEDRDVLTVDRNMPAHIRMLPPPRDKKSDGVPVHAETVHTPG